MIKFKKSDIPNYISVFRLCLIPVFLYFYFEQRNTARAACVFLLAGMSDVLDGYLARRNQWVSNMGRILDPVADKCMQSTVLISLSVDRIVPWAISAVLIGKELLMVLGATRLIKKFNTYAQSGWYGKGAVVLFYAVVVSLMLFDMGKAVKIILSCLLIFAMFFALTMYYLKTYRSKSTDGRTVKD